MKNQTKPKYYLVVEKYNNGEYVPVVDNVTETLEGAKEVLIDNDPGDGSMVILELVATKVFKRSEDIVESKL